jgi:hypothetical protein
MEKIKEVLSKEHKAASDVGSEELHMVPPFESENRAIALTDASDSIVN